MALAVIFLVIGAGVGFGAGWLLSGGAAGPGGQLGTLKAGFIYVGPIGDIGWTHAHEQGRLYMENKYPWFDSLYLEAVAEEEADDRIDYLVNQGCDVVFTTSFGYMDYTISAGTRHPDKMFFHCSGYKRGENVGTYFADFYQLYYLNGLMAGALSQTGKIGYVAAFPLPELIRHINAFALGAQEVNASIETHVRWLLTDWYDPVEARAAAEDLIAAGCDVLAFTEDSSAVVQVADENEGVYAFSHYSPMRYFSNTSCVSGQLVHWELMYEHIIQKIYLGQYNNTNLEDVDLLWLLKEGGVELGGLFGEPINPEFEEELEDYTVNDPLLGEISVYDLIFERLTQMSDFNVVFDPFTGPIYDQDDTLMYEAGERATMFDLLAITWFVKGVVGDPSP